MIKILTVTLSLFSSSVVVGVTVTDERGWSVVTCSVTVTVVSPVRTFVHQTIACMKNIKLLAIAVKQKKLKEMVFNAK